MKKIITTALLAGSLMSMFGASALFAAQNPTEAMIEKAKEDAAAFRKASAQSVKKMTEETKVLADEALEKAMQIALSTKGVSQVKAFFVIRG